MEYHNTPISGRRIAAFIVDHFIISIICITPFMSLSMLSMDGGMARFFQGLSLVIAAAFICYALKDVFGRSLGKWLFGISIINIDNPQTKPSVPNRILRNLTVFIWPVEAIVMLRNADRRRLGDRLGHTIIVSDEKRKHPVLAGILAFILFDLALMLGITQIIRNGDSFKAAAEYLKHNSKITAIVGDVENFGSFPSGSVSTSNGHGSAELKINVYGSKGDLAVWVELSKSPDSDWVVEHISY